MKKIGTRSIETKRLLLRPFLESDAQLCMTAGLLVRFNCM